MIHTIQSVSTLCINAVRGSPNLSFAIPQSTITVPHNGTVPVKAAASSYGSTGVSFSSYVICPSGYQCPSQNASAGGRPDSRHMYGDAVDMGSVTRSQAEWNLMYAAALDALQL